MSGHFVLFFLGSAHGWHHVFVKKLFALVRSAFPGDSYHVLDRIILRSATGGYSKRRSLSPAVVCRLAIGSWLPIKGLLGPRPFYRCSGLKHIHSGRCKKTFSQCLRRWLLRMWERLFAALPWLQWTGRNGGHCAPKILSANAGCGSKKVPKKTLMVKGKFNQKLWSL